MRLQLHEDSPIVVWLNEHRPDAVDALEQLNCTELEIRNVTERRMCLVAVIGSYALKFCALEDIDVAGGTFDRQADNDELSIVVDWCIVGN